MHTDLIQELKARMPDFTNEAKLAYLASINLAGSASIILAG